MVDDDDVIALFDNIIVFLDVAPAKVQDSPDSSMIHFSAKEVEEAQLTIAQLLISTIDRRWWFHQ